MYVATRNIEHPKLRLTAGMPFPHQRNKNYLRQARETFGEDCMEWRENVDLRKVDEELSLLRAENRRLKAKLGLLKDKQPTEESDEATVAILTQANESLAKDNAALKIQVAEQVKVIQRLESQLAECRDGSGGKSKGSKKGK